MKEIDKQIYSFVKKVRSRLREQSMIDNLIQCISVGLLLGTIVLAISLVIPFYIAFPVALVGCLCGVIAGVIRGVKKTPNMEQAALLVDAKGYKEKISTALYLAGKEDSFSCLQKKDALQITKNFEIRKAFSIRVSGKAFLIMIGLLLCFCICSYVDTPAKRKAVVSHQVKKETKEEIAKLEKVEKELEKNDTISEQEMVQLHEQLESAKKELKELSSREELAKVKERINKKMDLAADQSQNKEVSETLSKVAEESRAQSEAEKEELTKEAMEALEKAKEGSDKDKEKAYEKMKELAEKSSDAELAKQAERFSETQITDVSLAEAKKAIENNSNQAKQNSSNNANKSQKKEGNNQNTNAQNQNSSSQNQNSNENQNSSEAGQESQNGNKDGGGNQSGNGEENGDGNGAGNGEAGGSGQNGNGGGSGWNQGSKEGHEGPAKVDENITVPDGELGNDEDLTGQTNGNDSEIREKSKDGKAWSGNKVNYDAVSGKYKNKAYSKINGSKYPSKMKNKIKHYFDGLN